MELIIIFFLIGFISGKISLNIMRSNTYKLLFQFFDKGKKIDSKVITKFEKIFNEKEKTSKVKKIGTVLMFLPIINIIYATFEGIMIRRDLRKYLERNNGLIDMTEEEKNNYKSLKDVESKLSYIVLITHSYTQKPVIKVKNRVILNENQILRLKCERLTPLAYTLDDVKILNSCTTGEYITGHVRDCNIALVGCETGLDFTSITFNTPIDKNKIYLYKRFTEEEAKDKTFVVYPYNEEVESKVQKGVDMVIQKRFERESRPKRPLLIEKPKILKLTQNK